MAHNWHPATVVKIPNGCSIKIFENEKYEETLCSRLRNGYEDAYNLGNILFVSVAYLPWYSILIINKQFMFVNYEFRSSKAGVRYTRDR